MHRRRKFLDLRGQRRDEARRAETTQQLGVMGRSVFYPAGPSTKAFDAI